MTATQWTRMALTGRKDGATPSDTEIEDFQESVAAEIAVDYPCVPATPSNLTLDAYLQWLGYATAIAMRQGGWKPLGNAPIGGSGLTLVEVDSGGVKEKYSALSAAAAEQEITGWEATIARAKNRIPCIAEANRPTESDYDSAFAGLAGRRRSVGCRRY